MINELENPRISTMLSIQLLDKDEVTLLSFSPFHTVW